MANLDATQLHGVDVGWQGQVVAHTDGWDDQSQLHSELAADRGDAFEQPASWSLDQRGGTGRTWDWDLARELLAKRHVFIAGGLEPGNVGKVVSSFKPYGVDVSSGVEASVRIKDPDKVRAFVHAVRLSEILS